jgi:hypothetical protein
MAIATCHLSRIQTIAQHALSMIVGPVVVTVNYLDKLFGRQTSPHM